MSRNTPDPLGRVQELAHELGSLRADASNTDLSSLGIGRLDIL